MLKSIAAVIAAAAIAGMVTLLSAGNAPVDAGPVAKPVEAAVTQTCIPQPWPYPNTCGGAPINIRLVRTERAVR
jgi:hypothetical protein